MIRKGELYINTKDLLNICLYCFGVRGGQNIYNIILKEFIDNERQSIHNR